MRTGRPNWDQASSRGREGQVGPGSPRRAAMSPSSTSSSGAFHTSLAGTHVGDTNRAQSPQARGGCDTKELVGRGRILFGRDDGDGHARMSVCIDLRLIHRVAGAQLEDGELGPVERASGFASDTNPETSKGWAVTGPLDSIHIKTRTSWPSYPRHLLTRKSPDGRGCTVAKAL